MGVTDAFGRVLHVGDTVIHARMAGKGQDRRLEYRAGRVEGVGGGKMTVAWRGKSGVARLSVLAPETLVRVEVLS